MLQEHNLFAMEVVKSTLSYFYYWNLYAKVYQHQLTRLMINAPINFLFIIFLFFINFKQFKHIINQLQCKLNQKIRDLQINLK